MSSQLIDLITEMQSNDAITKEEALRTIKTVLSLTAKEPPKKPKTQSGGKDRMVDGKEVQAILEKAPSDGMSVEDICGAGIEMGFPWPRSAELCASMVARRLSKDSKQYRLLPNNKWVLRKLKIVNG